MTNERPKVIKAAMLPNNLMVLNFDNGERRYLPSHFATQYENSLAGDKKNARGTRRTFFVKPTTVFLGNAFDIQADGTLVMNEKDIYTPQELWENSVLHLSDARAELPDATHWKRNLVIALLLMVPFLVLAIWGAIYG